MCNKCAEYVQDSVETIDRTDLSEGEIPDDEIVFDDDEFFYTDDGDE